MIKGIESFYERIANSMIEGIPEEWSAASFEAAFFPDGSSFQAEYTRKADGVARDFQPEQDGIDAFKKLRKRFKSAGRRLWGRACFELRANGSFDMKWVYEDCDRQGYAIFDEEAERRRREGRLERLSR